MRVNTKNEKKTNNRIHANSHRHTLQKAHLFTDTMCPCPSSYMIAVVKSVICNCPPPRCSQVKSSVPKLSGLTRKRRQRRSSFLSAACRLRDRGAAPASCSTRPPGSSPHRAGSHAARPSARLRLPARAQSERRVEYIPVALAFCPSCAWCKRAYAATSSRRSAIHDPTAGMRSRTSPSPPHAVGTRPRHHQRWLGIRRVQETLGFLTQSRCRTLR